jgi:SH3 domain protein
MIGYIPVPVVHYSKKRINLRELPSLQAPIVIQIPKGIKIYLESKENNWYFASCYISENYYQGYIHQSVIK